ncbi:MAG TPA: PAS domain S-box protein, partial [Gammaproteobacteria bacterium]|nr:PAS domain S-box protein [Gammaproteobacteria bacterium]
MMRAAALRYALAPACVLLAALLYFSPAQPLLSLAGLFVFAVIGAAWFGGAGPGLTAAVLATFALPRLVAVDYPLLGGLLDVPRFITFSVAGLAVGLWSWRHRQVEAALRESAERYQLAIDASDEGFWDWAPHGDRLYVSPRFLEIFGFPSGTTFAGRAAMFERLTMPPDDRAGLNQAVAEHFAGKTTRMEMEFRIVVNGEVRWIHARGLATRNVDGGVIRWNGAAADVSARKHAEQALRESEDRFARAVAGSSDGVWDIDFVGRTVFFPARTRELCG